MLSLFLASRPVPVANLGVSVKTRPCPFFLNYTVPFESSRDLDASLLMQIVDYPAVSPVIPLPEYKTTSPHSKYPHPTLNMLVQIVMWASRVSFCHRHIPRIALVLFAQCFRGSFRRSRSGSKRESSLGQIRYPINTANTHAMTKRQLPRQLAGLADSVPTFSTPTRPKLNAPHVSVVIPAIYHSCNCGLNSWQTQYSQYPQGKATRADC